ncbi:MAG: cupin domain-containing protein [Alphaproteobacteria bacterium]
MTERTAKTSTAKGDAELMDIGVQIRGLRQAHGYTLQRLSELCGRSVGFISKIERGLARPSMTALQDIAEVLDVPVGWFFASDGPVPAEERPFVVRRGARRRLSYAGIGSTDYLGFRDELLSANLDGKLALGISTYEPGGSTGDEMYTHDGEEAGLILEGAIDLYLDDNVFRLKEGDSFSFSSQRPHRYVNAGSGRARVLWANTPISLRTGGP